MSDKTHLVSTGSLYYNLNYEFPGKAEDIMSHYINSILAGNEDLKTSIMIVTDCNKLIAQTFSINNHHVVVEVESAVRATANKHIVFGFEVNKHIVRFKVGEQ